MRKQWRHSPPPHIYSIRKHRQTYFLRFGEETVETQTDSFIRFGEETLETQTDSFIRIGEETVETQTATFIKFGEEAVETQPAPHIYSIRKHRQTHL